MGAAGELEAYDTNVRQDPRILANNYLWALHGALLLKLGVEETRKFWAEHPLSLHGIRLSEVELARHLANDRAFSPLVWAIEAQNDIERFALERGVLYETVQGSVMRFANGGTWVSSRQILTWLSPLFVPLFRFGDPYRLLLHAAALSGRQFSPSLVCKVLQRRADASKLSPAVREGGLWATHPGLAEGDTPGWDAQMTTARQIQIGAGVFGLPPFRDAQTVCDARPASTIPWVHAAELRGDDFYVDHQRLGHAANFQDFVPLAGYDLPQDERRNPRVVVIDHDYFCPQRQRVVLRAGCAYGAPGYVLRFTWDKPEQPVRNFLAVLTADPEDDGVSEAEREARELGRAYLAAVAPRIHVVFYQTDESISVNGNHLCTGVAARILFECLRTLRDEGRNEFALRELRRRPELISHPKNTGLELRIKRLANTLAQAQCGLRVDRSERGRFRLTCSGALQLEER